MAQPPAQLTVLLPKPRSGLSTSCRAQHVENAANHARRNGGDLIRRCRRRRRALRQRRCQSAFRHRSATTKQNSCAFGEFLPPGLPVVPRHDAHPDVELHPGPVRQEPMPIGEQRIAINICYEDVFGAEISRPARRRPAHQSSNTAWFGDSLAQPQHLQIAQLRALKPAARCCADQHRHDRGWSRRFARRRRCRPSPGCAAEVQNSHSATRRTCARGTGQCCFRLRAAGGATLTPRRTAPAPLTATGLSRLSPPGRQERSECRRLNCFSPFQSLAIRAWCNNGQIKTIRLNFVQHSGPVPAVPPAFRPRACRRPAKAGGET